jgi:hypothetical protein
VVEPVNETMSTSGWEDIAAPTTLPLPITRLKTPGGTPASCIVSASKMAQSGDTSDGFRMEVQPAASA